MICAMGESFAASPGKACRLWREIGKESAGEAPNKKITPELKG